MEEEKYTSFASARGVGPQLLESWHDAYHSYIVMKNYTRGTLEAFLEERDLTKKEWEDLDQALVHLLAELENMPGVCHNDLHIGNIVIDDDGSLKAIDGY